MDHEATQTPTQADAPDPRFSHPKVRADDARGAPPDHFGQPPFVPTEEQRAQVRNLAKAYPPEGEHLLAHRMGISRATLRKYFYDDLMTGRSELVGSVGAQMAAGAMNKDSEVSKGDYKRMRYVLDKYCSTGEKHVSRMELTGKNGGPIETVDLSRLNAEQLEAYGRLAATVAGVDPDTIIAVPRD